MRQIRHIPLEHARNLRDLGGYPTPDGRSTRWGLLYRSDDLSSLQEEEWEVLRRRNVRTLLDLRSAREAKSRPVRPPFPLDYRRLSLMRELDERPSGRAASGSILASMRLDYTETLFGNPDCAVRILELVREKLSRGEGSLVFFCSAGKDRTGITAALILTLCGVIREDIVADYMVSGTYNTEGINQRMNSLPDDLPEWMPDAQVLRDLMESKPENILALLDAFRERDLSASLAAHGFDRKKQKELADLLLLPPADEGDR